MKNCNGIICETWWNVIETKSFVSSKPKLMMTTNETMYKDSRFLSAIFILVVLLSFLLNA